MDHLRDYVEQQKKQQALANRATNGDDGWWHWPLFGSLSVFALLFVGVVVGEPFAENKSQKRAAEIVALGKADPDRQRREIADASEPVLYAVEKLAPDLVKTERDRRKAEELRLFAETVKASIAKTEIKQRTKYREMLRREIKSMRENPKMESLADAQEDDVYVTVNTALIATRARLLADAPPKLTPELNALQREYIELQKLFQRDAFPRLRRIQAKIWREKLWKNDIEVRVFGSRADRVMFTAGMFAANQNKQAAHDAALPTLRILRFRRDAYEWYQGSESAYWDLGSLADDEIATVDSQNNWRPIKM
jgi:hypothetical protein